MIVLKLHRGAALNDAKPFRRKQLATRFRKEATAHSHPIWNRAPGASVSKSCANGNRQWAVQAIQVANLVGLKFAAVRLWLRGYRESSVVRRRREYLSHVFDVDQASELRIAVHVFRRTVTENRYMNALTKLVGWATPIVPRFSVTDLARQMGQSLRGSGRRGGCVARRQGRCPGLEFCEDCPWSEGVSRDGT